MGIHHNFEYAIDHMIKAVLDRGHRIQPNFWQGTDTSNRPEAEMIEVLNLFMQVPIGTEDLNTLVRDIKPDLPWADEHFLERVSGIPYNPPPSSFDWKYAKDANSEFKKAEIFDHTYPERFWPKDANFTAQSREVRRGIRYPYGDLEDLVKLLARDPGTRQAFLPIFFPEDTGSVGNIRVPCTIGYHFIMRKNFLHVTYWIRSMDILRHARNDFYLTVRLLLWVLKSLRELDSRTWNGVKPGFFNVHCVSAHCFIGDPLALRKQLK